MKELHQLRSIWGKMAHSTQDDFRITKRDSWQGFVQRESKTRERIQYSKVSKTGRTSLLFVGLKVTRTFLPQRGQGGGGFQSGAETRGWGLWLANGDPEGTWIKCPNLNLLPLSVTLLWLNPNGSQRARESLMLSYSSASQGWRRTENKAGDAKLETPSMSPKSTASATELSSPKVQAAHLQSPQKT